MECGLCTSKIRVYHGTFIFIYIIVFVYNKVTRHFTSPIRLFHNNLHPTMSFLLLLKAGNWFIYCEDESCKCAKNFLFTKTKKLIILAKFFFDFRSWEIIYNDRIMAIDKSSWYIEGNKLCNDMCWIIWKCGNNLEHLSMQHLYRQDKRQKISWLKMRV